MRVPYLETRSDRASPPRRKADKPQAEKQRGSGSGMAEMESERNRSTCSIATENSIDRKGPRAACSEGAELVRFAKLLPGLPRSER